MKNQTEISIRKIQGIKSYSVKIDLHLTSIKSKIRKEMVLTEKELVLLKDKISEVLKKK